MMMTTKVCLLLVSFGILCALNGRAGAQTSTIPAHDVAIAPSKVEDPVTSKSSPELSREIEELRRRVEDLESQNRALAELLNAVKTKLAAMPETAQPDERRAALAAPPAAEKPSQTKPAESDQPLRWSDILG